MKNAFIFMLLLSMAASCAFNNEEDLYDNQNCDTEDVTYSGTIVPVLEANCYTCHDDENASVFASGIKLEGYAQLKLYVDNGRLLGAIKHAPGFSPMPRSAAQLPECTIRQIEAWVSRGALDN